MFNPTNCVAFKCLKCKIIKLLTTTSYECRKCLQNGADMLGKFFEKNHVLTKRLKNKEHRVHTMFSTRNALYTELENAQLKDHYR